MLLLPSEHLFSSRPPKNTIVLFFFKFPFPFFHFLSFALSNMKKQQTKNALIFYRKPFFWHPTTYRKPIFAPLHTICDFKLPPSHYKIEGKQATKSWTDFDSTLARSWTQKRPNLGQIFDSTARIYIYICMLDSRFGDHIWPLVRSQFGALKKKRFFLQNGAPWVTVRGPQSDG